MTPTRVLFVTWLALVSAGCKSCKESSAEREHEATSERDEEDQDEEQEEQDDNRDNFWRAQISIVGQGTVKTASAAFDCTSDGTKQSGRCGPTLVRFKERQPPLMRALAANGWRFERWEATLREPNGTMRSRQGPMPDGAMYLNGFGYSDTGQLETVTAIFVADR